MGELKLDFSSIEKFAKSCEERGWVFVPENMTYDFVEKKYEKSEGSGAKCIIPVEGVEDEEKEYENFEVIHQISKKWEHIGTSILKGIPGWLRTKTFNLYKKGDVYVVTNHYGEELINAFVYPNKKQFERDWRGITWIKYRFLILP